jgi:hypothetical protein
MRVGLIEEEKDRHILVVDMHHIISDGVSHLILVQDFLSLYEGNGLSPLRLQYKDYSHWQKNPGLGEKEKLRKQEEYWLKQYEQGVPELNWTILADNPGSIDKSAQIDTVEFTIEKDLFKKIEKRAEETRTTLFMILFSIYNILISKYTRQEDIVIGSPVIGRNHVDLETIIGMFVNMLALRNRPEGKKTYREFLLELKENILQAFENENYQFDELVMKLGLERNTHRNPLFEAVFNMLNLGVESSDVERSEMGNLKVSPYPIKHSETQFYLILMAFESSDMIWMNFLFSTALFKRDSIRKMKDHYLHIARQVLENLDIKLADIKLSHDLITIKSSPLRSSSVGFDF